jgi:hypothetical protein
MTADFGRPNVLARNSRASELAFPSIGGAAILTFSTFPERGSSSQPTISLDRALGITLTTSFTSPESANLRRMPVWSFAPPGND